jgi:hypothetical protein
VGAELHLAARVDDPLRGFGDLEVVVLLFGHEHAASRPRV